MAPLKRDRDVSHEYAPVVLRALRKPDLCSCCRIDRLASQQEHRWNEIEWYDTVQLAPTIVAVQGIAVVGFAVFDIRAKRLDLLKIAVNPRNWRQGIGTLLLGRVLDACREHQRNYVRAIVPLDFSNMGALNFFKALDWPGALAEGGNDVSFVKHNPKK